MSGGGSENAHLPAGSAPGFFQVIALGGSSSSGVAYDQQTREYKRRRPHKKSRDGCSACKQRRVKCDQAAPSCLRCRRNKRECQYDKTDDPVAPASSRSEPKASHRRIPVSSGSNSNVSDANTGSNASAWPRRHWPQLPPGPGSNLSSLDGPSALAESGVARAQRGMRSAVGHFLRQEGYGQAALVPPAAMAAANQPNFRVLQHFSLPFPTNGHEYGTPSAELLHHFELASTSVFGMPKYTASVMPMASEYPHLCGTILAIAASHLCHTAPVYNSNQMAEKYYQTIALQHYQRALATPMAEQGQTGVDALLMTAVFMNLLSFLMPVNDDFATYVKRGQDSHGAGTASTSTAAVANNTTSRPPSDPSCSVLTRANTNPYTDLDPDPRLSWVFSQDENRLGWLALQMGLGPLLQATGPWLKNSFLRPLFANSDDERRTLTGSWQSLSRVPQHWLDMLGLDRSSNPPTVPGVVTVVAIEPPATPAAVSDSIGPGSGRDSGPETKTSGDRASGCMGSRGCSPMVETPGSNASSASSGSSRSSGSGGSGGSSHPTICGISDADLLYRAPARILAELRLLKATPSSLLLFFQFIGKLDSAFRQKLYERDVKALWLFGMWMGLMCQFDNVWWTRRRTRCDFRGIRLYLHLTGLAQQPGREGQMWCKLLQDMDNTWGYNFETDPLMGQHRF